MLRKLFKPLNLAIMLALLFNIALPIGTGRVEKAAATTFHVIAPICDFNSSIEQVNAGRSHKNAGTNAGMSWAGKSVDIGAPNTPYVAESDTSSSSDPLVLEPRLTCSGSNIYAAISGTAYIKPDGCGANMLEIHNSTLGIRIRYVHGSYSVANNTQVTAGAIIGTAAANGCAGGYVHNHIVVMEKDAEVALTYSSDHSNLTNQWKFGPLPRQVQLVNPVNNKVFTESKIQLTWGNLPDEVSYQVQLSYWVNGVGTVTDTYTVATNTTSYEFNKGTITNPEGITWRVRANYPDNINGAWSETRTFSYIPDEIALAEFNGNLFRAFRDNNNNVITEVYSGQIWEPLDQISGTPGNVNMVAFKGKLYQAVRGNSGGIFTRRSDNGITWPTSWTPAATGTAGSDINMHVFGENLYQTIAGTSRKVFTRSSSDGVTWSGWTDSTTNTGAIFYAASEIDSIVYNNTMYQTAVDLNNNVYIRTLSSLGTWSTWAPHHGGIAKAYTNVSSIVHDGKLFQAVVGGSGRVSTIFLDGNTWDTNGWQPYADGYSVVEVDMQSYGSTLFQSIRGNSGKVWTRKWNAGSWANWAPAFTSGLFQSQANMILLGNGDLQMHGKGLNGENVYTAFYNLPENPNAWTPEWDL